MYDWSRWQPNPPVAAESWRNRQKMHRTRSIKWRARCATAREKEKSAKLNGTDHRHTNSTSPPSHSYTAANRATSISDTTDGLLLSEYLGFIVLQHQYPQDQWPEERWLLLIPILLIHFTRGKEWQMVDNRVRNEIYKIKKNKKLADFLYEKNKVNRRPHSSAVTHFHCSHGSVTTIKLGSQK